MMTLKAGFNSRKAGRKRGDRPGSRKYVLLLYSTHPSADNNTTSLYVDLSEYSWHR